MWLASSRAYSSQPSGTTFDYYVSTTGSDSNAGTLASPWAITAINTKQATYAGKRVGLLPGTYDVSGLMGTNEAVGYSTLSAWASAIGGLETHSSTNGTNPFTNGGTYADQYQIQSGSPAYQAGRVGGTSGGAITNVGAWDGSGRPGASWVT